LDTSRPSSCTKWTRPCQELKGDLDGFERELAAREAMAERMWASVSAVSGAAKVRAEAEASYRPAWAEAGAQTLLCEPHLKVLIDRQGLPLDPPARALGAAVAAAEARAYQPGVPACLRAIVGEAGEWFAAREARLAALAPEQVATARPFPAAASLWRG
jgi:hypothetical protein